MTCEACQRAEKNPHTGIYMSKCQNCEARMLANSPTMADSARAAAILPGYRDALQRVFGDDWMAGHEKVKAWSDRMRGQTKTKEAQP